MTELSQTPAGAPVVRPALPERVPITLDEIPYAVMIPDADGSPLTWRRTLIEPDTGHAVFNVKFGPGQRGEAHWHPSDTLYVFLSGSLLVEGEDEYHAGQVRFVRGGFAYGAEVGGAEGCEFLFVSLGEYGRFDPDTDPPPRGRWDQVQ